MDSQGFLDAFEHIANAPGGIAQLRSMIYQLAVTGALTPRLEGGLSALELLRQVNETRQSLIKAKRYKRMLELEAEPVTPPQGIQIPENWEWSRLLDLGEINPRNAANDGDRVAFLPMRGVPADHRGTVEIEQGKWGDLKKGYTHFAVGDVVLAKITPCFENGKAAVIPSFQDGLTIGGGTTELLVFRPIHSAINTAYVYLFLRSPMFAVDGEARMTGTAGQKRLPTEYFATCAFPLPPVDEQGRIVAKVDQLMILCDRLEKQQMARWALQGRVRKALIQTVAGASASSDVLGSWSKLTDNLADLFPCSGDVDELKLLVFKSASQGVLSDSKNQYEGFENLLQLLEKQQKNEFSNREMRELQALPLPEIQNGGVSFCIGHVSKIISGQHLKPEEYTSSKSGIPYITGPAEFNDGNINPNKWTDQRRAVASIGDILLTVKGSGVGKIARCNLHELAISRQLMAVRALNGISPDYLELCLLAAKDIFSDQKTGIAIPGIGREEVLALPIFMPDFEEQCRIVARVNKLVELCVTLQNQLRLARSTSESLARAAVSSITGIAVADEEAELKAPQTDLIAPLRIGAPPSGTAQAPLASILVRHSGSLSAKDLWQRFGGEIGGFYAQLKHEVAQGWIVEPEVAEMRERESA